MFDKIWIYLLLIAVIVASNILLSLLIKKEKARRITFSLIGFICLFFLIAMRDISVGSDTKAYYDMYLKFHNVTLTGIEPGYATLMKVAIFLKFPYQGFLAFMALLTLIPLFFFFYRNSSNLCLSFIIFICFYFFSFYLSAIRNSAAISIILLAYEALKIKKDWLKFLIAIILVGIATSIHRSAILVSPLLLFAHCKLDLKYLIYLVLIIIIAFLYRTQVYEFINQYIYKLGNTPALHIGGRVLLLSIILVLCAIIILPSKAKLFHENTAFSKLLYREKTEKEKSFPANSFSVMAVFVSIVFGVIAGDSDFARVGLYFSIFVCILLPNTINCIKSKYLRGIVVGVVIIFFIGIYYFTELRENFLQISPYKFFFQ